ncbi:abasic site processing protein HMCES [Osmerus mordax]|uniref:Abasic site processing protein HMCES n=1 Tax=Osmerus mordax TaxID=8014 RepID=C1BM08_OSMMO|nr:UPF0361 protein DC12 homolog [Osmerus mordax]
MCGRTACTLAPDEVCRASRYRDRAGQRRQPRWKDGDSDKYRPSYNKSPQSMSPVLLSLRHFDKNAPVDECVLAAMRWGLVPSWFKESDPRKMQYNTNNCRSDTLLEKKSYKDPLLKGQRCVILADGFYEWRRQEKDKQPFFIYFPQVHKQEKTEEPEALLKENTLCSLEEDQEWTGWKVLTIAGLFDCWMPPGGGDPLYTYTIITVDASPNLQCIHDRMPAILDGEEEIRRWLDYGEVKSLEALHLLQSKNTLTYHCVSSLVNNSRNNSPECLQPVDPQIKKEPKPTASSKMMMSWLKGSKSSKRKEPDSEETKEEEHMGAHNLPIKTSPEKKTKPAGSLQQWLQGAGKKPRTN